MVGNVAISVRNVGKSYQLYKRPSDRLKQMLFWRFGRRYGREFWALRDVSFEATRGEAVGIIGRNGSGKSTLLQIIAGTLKPTSGEVQVNGRSAALLELGSGFNPEFTGRENVFLNGSILGAGREELVKRYDEIAEFADIGDFIDQPVKLYSSGMVVRLAFAVQAVIEKDVLIVDEALAVGDEAFQRKCMRKLEQFRENGGTVLLVTHSAQMIVRHCTRCLFLNNGRLILDGPSKPVTDVYQRFIYGTAQEQRDTLKVLQGKGSESIDTLLRLVSQSSEDTVPESQTATRSNQMFDAHVPKVVEVAYGGRQAEIFDCGMYDDAGYMVNVLVVGGIYTWRYRVRFHKPAWDVKFGMMLKTVDGLQVAGINSTQEGQRFERMERDSIVEVDFKLRMNLTPGTYYLNSGVMGDTADLSGYLHRRTDICAVRVIPADGRTTQGLAYIEPELEVRSVDPKPIGV